MNTEFRIAIGMPSLAIALGVETTKDLNLKQKKAVKNIKWCAEDQWQWVNSYYDCQDESARAYMLNAREMFDTIYTDSQENIYEGGSVSFGGGAKSWLKDIRFCGKEFLQTVCLYYTAKVMEEAFDEVDGTEEDAERIFKDFVQLRMEVVK